MEFSIGNVIADYRIIVDTDNELIIKRVSNQSTNITWILKTSIWNDSGQWVDTENWND